jgi:integrase
MSDIVSYLETYCELSTTKREKMSTSYAKILRYNISSFAASTERANELRGAALVVAVRVWLQSRDLKTSSRKAIATAMSKYLNSLGYLSQKEADALRKSYRSSLPSWSEKSLTQAQVEHLLSTPVRRYKKNPSYTRSRDLFGAILMAMMGVRVGQLCSIKVDSLNASNEFITFAVPRQKSRAEGLIEKKMPIAGLDGSALVYCGVDVKKLFVDFVSKRPMSQYLFANEEGERLCESYWRERMAYWSKVSGIKASPHSLRHAAGTRVATKVGVVQAAALLDHSDVQTTQRYIKKATANESMRSVLASL